MKRKVDFEEIECLVRQAKMLIKRLERISADSIWARRSSGHRGALLKWVDAYEEKPVLEGIEVTSEKDIESLQRIITAGYQLLVKAAQEYPEGEK